MAPFVWKETGTFLIVTSVEWKKLKEEREMKLKGKVLVQE
jgi:hypothetical protein